MIKKTSASCCLVASIVVATAFLPCRVGAQSKDLTTLSLEELMRVNVSVTSAARREQRLNDVAAAVYVLTADDIRRSGARTIPDALRLVPGVQVAQIDTNKWAVTARGFNGRFANKLLVLMDGRSIYSPLFSGVFWDLHHDLPEDIERIEVIRGPGASLWGANAVNGVINIITKSAKDTQGGMASLGTGTSDRGFGSVRWGGKAGEQTYWRAGFQGLTRRAQDRADDGPRADGVLEGVFNVRVDGEDGADSWHINAGHTGNRAGETSYRFALTAPYKTPVNMRTNSETQHVLGRWSRKLSATSDLQLQAYASRERSEYSQASALAQTFDMELQHRVRWGERHQFVWGGGLRVRGTGIESRSDLALVEPHRVTRVASLFVQDEVSLVPDTLSLTLGSRFEHHPYSGLNVQPNARLSWTPDDRNTLWASVARAVRTPSIGEASEPSGTLDVLRDRTTGLPIVISYRTSNNTEAETVTAFEAGYRARPLARVSTDIAGFYNLYRSLRGGAPRDGVFIAGPPSRIIVITDTNYENDARVYGGEFSVEWRPIDHLRIRSAYSLTHLKVESDVARSTTDGGRRTPRHQGFVHASYDVTPEIKLDGVLRGATRLASSDTTNVPGYVTVDARIAWQATPSLEVALVGTNLVGGERIEFLPDQLGIVPTRVGPTGYLKATIRF